MPKNRRNGGNKGKTRTSNDDRTDLIEKIDMTNEKFFAYYRAQGLVPEDEWESFVGALRQHLPTTFRVAGSRQTAKTLNETIEDIHVPALSNVIFEEQAIPPPVQIPWYPDGLAWHFNVPKKVLRKSPEFKKFHSFLVFETEVGNISRQEAVSMLPPLFLDVEPHHIVMDMCAAPGSKTAQILESLHANDTATSTSIPSGLLIANDSDNKRTHLLIHQSARLPSPALMVTNLDASNYPSIRLRGEVKKSQYLLFDRILCDVPCSGDGTMRKNIGIWKSWQPGDGNGLHSLQVRILQRAMKLLKHDGRIVYSTCSLNPVENEAVVAEALGSNRQFHLVDVSEKLLALKRREGLSTWKISVSRTSLETYDSYDDLMASSVEDTTKAKFSEGHWPPKDVEKFNLARCMRIYPHLQDTGGFFIAVLEKRKDLEVSHAIPPREKKREGNEPEEPPEPKKIKIADDDIQETMDILETADDPTPVADNSASDPPRGVATTSDPKNKQIGNATFKENPYTFLSPDDPILLSCMHRLHINSSFPSSNILVRNPEGDAVRSLYLANDMVRSVIENNDYARIRLNAAGTKVFSKQESGKGVDAQFRVLGEGLPVIVPYIEPSTIITANIATLKTLIESYYPLCSTFSEPFRSLVEAREPGSHVVRFPPGECEGVILTHELVLPIWKSIMSLTLMIDKKAKSALSLRLFGTNISMTGPKKSGPQPKVSHPDLLPADLEDVME